MSERIKKGGRQSEKNEPVTDEEFQPDQIKEERSKKSQSYILFNFRQCHKQQLFCSIWTHWSQVMEVIQGLNRMPRVSS